MCLAPTLFARTLKTRVEPRVQRLAEHIGENEVVVSIGATTASRCSICFTLPRGAGRDSVQARSFFVFDTSVRRPESDTCLVCGDPQIFPEVAEGFCAATAGPPLPKAYREILDFGHDLH